MTLTTPLHPATRPTRLALAVTALALAGAVPPADAAANLRFKYVAGVQTYTHGGAEGPVTLTLTGGSGGSTTPCAGGPAPRAARRPST